MSQAGIYTRSDSGTQVDSAQTSRSSIDPLIADSHANYEYAKPNTKQQKGNFLKLLTFNTWGLKYVSKFRAERLKAIADKLAGTFRGVPLDEDINSESNSGDKDYDVVALQEIWCQEDWDYLVSKTKTRYPYQRWFSSGIITGPGLAILSKIPIEETFLYRFPINGRPSAFWRGDWFVGKSLSVTILKHSGGARICVMNSHMHAPYSATGDAAYYCHRSCQSWDISKMIKLYKQAGYYVILVGDLNSKPGTLPYQFLTLESGLTDSWNLLQRDHTSLAQIAEMPPIDQVRVGGCTCDSLLNTWRASRLPTEACRLDYALVDHEKFTPVDCGVEFTERIPAIGSFSDHFAYSCKLELHSGDPSVGHVSESQQIVEQKLKVLNEMLYVLHDYYKTAYWQKNWRLVHFFSSVVFLVIMFVISTFTSNIAGWSSVLILIASVVVAITGLTNGMIGYLFGKKEIRALHEVEQEVQDYKKSMERSID